MAAMAPSAGAGAVTAATREALVHGLVELAKTISASGTLGWIHPDCIAYICARTCPNATLSPRELLKKLTKKGGTLYNLRREQHVVHEGCQLKIHWDIQGEEQNVLPDGTPSAPLKIKWFALAGEPGSSKKLWLNFRRECLDNMEPQPLDNYETVVKALGQISDVINDCPLPLPPVADEKRERLKLAMFLAGVAPPPASLGLNHRWQPAAVAVRDTWKLPSEPAAPDAAGGDVTTRPGQANAEDPGTFPNVATTHGQRTTAPAPAPSFDADLDNRRKYPLGMHRG